MAHNLFLHMCFSPVFIFERKGCDVWPSMATHTWNLCSAFNPSKCTHTAVSSEHTHGAVGSQCCGARGAVGGSVPCSRALQSWYWGWRECWTFTPLTYNPCWTWDSNLRPSGYKSNCLSIRPRLPPFLKCCHSWCTYVPLLQPLYS